MSKIRFISEECEREILDDDSWLNDEEDVFNEVDEDDPLSLAIYNSMED